MPNAAQQLIPLRTATPQRRATRRDPSIRPTEETYAALQVAYDCFNECLFGDCLPNCIITLKRRSRSYGFFAGNRYARLDGRECDEIALNPVHFRDRGLADTLSTLVHEMVHLWQHRHGRPGRGSYHNRQWAEKMKLVGLYTSNTGKAGGREIGDSMSHYIMPNGPFARSLTILDRRGFAIPWAEVPVVTAMSAGGRDDGTTPGAESKSGKRVKYVCPICGQNALSRHGAQLTCTPHNEPMLPA